MDRRPRKILYCIGGEGMWTDRRQRTQGNSNPQEDCVHPGISYATVSEVPFCSYIYPPSLMDLDVRLDIGSYGLDEILARPITLNSDPLPVCPRFPGFSCPSHFGTLFYSKFM